MHPKEGGGRELRGSEAERSGNDLAELGCDEKGVVSGTWTYRLLIQVIFDPG